VAAPNIVGKKRLFILLIFIGVIFAALIGRLFYVQVIWGPELQERALSQWTRDTSLSASRGRILDANGQVLAQSGTAYRVLVNPDSTMSDQDRVVTAEKLSQILEMDFDYVLSKLSDVSKQQIVLKRQVEWAQIEQLINNMVVGRVVTYSVDTKRYYPMGKTLSQTLGFTNVDGAGQEGLERAYNKYLAGTDGRLITEKDNKNRALAYGSEEYIAPENGCDLVLTTDAAVQSYLEKALKEAVEVNKANTAQGIIMNCNTGEIVALATAPDYDPNNPPRDDLALLQSLMKNRVVSDAYEPGSTFKILTLSAALDSGVVNQNSTFECPGYKIVNGERIKCWKNSHGHQTLEEVAKNSCNPAFMTMALGMGTEKFYDYLYAFGLGSSTESGLVGEGRGIVTHEKYIRDTDLARIGFGQSIAVTPIQLCNAVCAAVNGGELMQPYIVSKIISADGELIQETKPTVLHRVVSENTSAQVRSILEAVVESGSGKNAQIPGYRVGGKTGTAQKYGEDGGVAQGKLIASFVGFAPADNPQYVCLILVDEPKVGTIFGSTVAAPFVKDVLQETLMHYGILPTQDTPVETIPAVTGVTAEEAVRMLKESGLEGVFTEGEEQAQVIAQVPVAGSQSTQGSSVLLYTTETSADESGAESADGDVVVPDVTGKTRLEANDALKAKGLVLRIEPEDQFGEAIRQKPEAGTRVAYGSTVMVEFSSIGVIEKKDNE